MHPLLQAFAIVAGALYILLGAYCLRVAFVMKRDGRQAKLRGLRNVHVGSDTVR